MSEENPKKKFICLHCGNVFESEKEAPQCPDCHRRKVMPFDLFVQSVERHKDKFRELGILPESKDTSVTPDTVQSVNVSDTPQSDTNVDTASVTPESVTSESVDSVTEPVTSSDSVTSDTVQSVDTSDTPESDELLAKYLHDLDDEPEVKLKPSPSRKKRKPKKVTVPAGRSLVEVLILLGVAVLVYKWWTSRHSTPAPTSSDVDRRRYGSTYETINRNIGHKALG